MDDTAFVLYSVDESDFRVFHAVFTSRRLLDDYYYRFLSTQSDNWNNWDWVELPVNPTTGEGL